MRPGAISAPGSLSAKNAFHRQSRMARLFQEGINLVFGSAVFLGCDHIDEIRNAHFLTALDKSAAKFLFEHLWHPYKPHETAVTRNELALSDVVLAVTHKTRRNVSSADRTGKRGEFHAAGGHACVVTVHSHDSVAHRQDRCDALATPAGRHRVVNQAVEVIARNR